MASLKKMSLLLSGRVGQIVYDLSQRSWPKSDAESLEVWSLVDVSSLSLLWGVFFGAGSKSKLEVAGVDLSTFKIYLWLVGCSRLVV